LFKTKIVGAKKGHELLKKKADALKKAFRNIMLKILEVGIELTSVQKRYGQGF
jgi:vacuolar-type H+-ATPase subunit D/Vma8